MQISKLDSARRQLLAAIHIQWYMNEPIAAYQLAANAGEIADALLVRIGEVRMRERLMEVHQQTEAAVRGMINHPRNFTKHADRDHDAVIDDISAEDADAILMTACVDYSVAARRAPATVGLFTIWYAALNPEKTGDFLKREAHHLFPSLSEQPRETQIAAARSAINLTFGSETLHDRRNDLTDNWRWVAFRKQIK